MKIPKDKKFCKYHGKELSFKVEDTRFSTETGKPIQIEYRGKCPKFYCPINICFTSVVYFIEIL